MRGNCTTEDEPELLPAPHGWSSPGRV